MRLANARMLKGARKKSPQPPIVVGQQKKIPQFMEGHVSDNKRIAKNTLFMYIRMILVMCISLFTSRINLQSLGVEDYGIYSVVGSFVAMFSMFSNALSGAIQRFITYEIGLGDENRTKSVFSTSVTIMIILSIVLMLFADFIGVWFINNKMVLPPERVEAATWVLHVSVLTFGVGLISVPFNATIVAHERMSAFAYISIYEAVAKLAVCYLLFVSPFDRLIVWAVLLGFVQLTINVLYAGYCHIKFQECRYKPEIDVSLFKQIAGYAGWSTFGLVALTCYTQGLNMVLNIFFGPIVNAARSIANQVQTAVHGFASNFQVAMNPQIIRSYAQGELSRMHKLLFTGTRFSFFLLLFLSLPIVLEAPMVLRIWLGEYPEHTVNFIRLVLIMITFDTSFGGPMYVAQTATGDIKKNQIVVGGLMLMILPISYLTIKIFHTCPETIYIVYLIIVVIAHIFRMIIIRPMIKLSLRAYFKDVVYPIVKVAVFALPIPIITYILLPATSYTSFVVVCVACIISVSLSVYAVGITGEEKSFFIAKIKATFKKLLAK